MVPQPVQSLFLNERHSTFSWVSSYPLKYCHFHLYIFLSITNFLNPAVLFPSQKKGKCIFHGVCARLIHAACRFTRNAFGQSTLDPDCRWVTPTDRNGKWSGWLCHSTLNTTLRTRFLTAQMAELTASLEPANQLERRELIYTDRRYTLRSSVMSGCFGSSEAL